MDARRTRAPIKDEEADFLAKHNLKTPQLHLENKRVRFAIPASHKEYSDADDLPDIDKFVMQTLEESWVPKPLSNKRPLGQVVDAFRKHYDVIQPYMKVLKHTQPGWYDCWSFMHTIALDLDNESEDFERHRFYSEPEYLRRARVLAEAALAQSYIDYKQAGEDYLIAIEWRQAEIAQISKLVKEHLPVAVSDQDLDKIELTRSKIEETAAKYIKDREPQNAARAAEETADMNCWDKFRALFKRRDGDAPRRHIGKESVGDRRARLLAEYEADIEHKTKLLNDYPNPSLSSKFHENLMQARADSFFDKLDFFRSQSRDVMMHCLRLYVLAIRAYYRMYGESPLATEEELEKDKRIPLMYSEEEQVIFKAKDAFRQLIRGLKGNFDLYYCEQPDRLYFQDYLHNYNLIQDQTERDALLRGEFTEELLEKVFPEFETPAEAFILPESMRPSNKF